MRFPKPHELDSVFAIAFIIFSVVMMVIYW